MDKWNAPASKEIIEKTILALKANGIDAFYAETGEEAKKKVLEILPLGAEVMNMTSKTLETINLASEIQNSGKYDSVRNKLMGMKRETEGKEMQKLGAAPDWAIGSVQAVTQDGKILIASGTGSQLSAYAYGASHVIWVVGAQKIVKDSDEGIRRIYEHSFVLENERAKKAYGFGSSISKILTINREKPGRISIIFVNEVLGF